MSASSPRHKANAPEAEHAAVRWEEAARKARRVAGKARQAVARSAGESGRRAGGSVVPHRDEVEDSRGGAGAHRARDGGGDKPIRYIVQNLERAYGVPVNRRATDPLDMLVKIILSQATSDVNSDRTFAALKRRFPTWEAVLSARQSTLAETIRSGGLADQKAAVIRAILRRIKDERGALDLNFLHDLPEEEAVRFLSRFRGVGPKTAACTLLFACRKEVFPLDTHIFRVLRRVGLIPQKCSDRRAHEIMDAVVPPGKFYSLHVNLVRHGRKICRPRDPACDRCPIVEYCDYGQEKI